MSIKNINKMNKMKILTNLQIRALKIFSKLPVAKKFYLSGATALSVFYLKHRVSFDLEIFAFYKFRVQPQLLLETADEFISLLKKSTLR